ncbi:MAG: HU family DNA-binding protein [Pseudonocardiaceae bacterium]
MNKAELIDALADRLGDKKVAAAAVAGLVDVVVRAVNAGDKVTITGFGVFERRARAARTARNPRTGEAVTVQGTDVPAFRPGTLFREVVSGARSLPQAGASTVVRARSAAASPVAGSAATGRPAARVTSATHLAAVPTPAAEEPKSAPKAGKDAAKAGKAAKPGKAGNAAKAEPKHAGKGSGKGNAKGDGKKVGKKTAAKKSAAKK